MKIEAFESHRATMLALAYRMLGDMGRAEDIVQDAWVKWQRADVEVASVKAFLITTVTRLCLDELGSARARKEESRSDRLPEPVDLAQAGIDRIETLDQISMAFLVLLQRLTPAERAVLLLHDIFGMSHHEIGALLGKNDAACRQLLSRARDSVTNERRSFETSHEEHRRLLMAFVRAVNDADGESLAKLLSEDAVFIADAGPGGAKVGRLRNVGRPVRGRRKIIALLKAFQRAAGAQHVELHERVLNGEPAAVSVRDGKPVAAIIVTVAQGMIHDVFVHIDPERLKKLTKMHYSDQRE